MKDVCSIMFSSTNDNFSVEYFIPVTGFDIRDSKWARPGWIPRTANTDEPFGREIQKTLSIHLPSSNFISIQDWPNNRLTINCFVKIGLPNIKITSDLTSFKTLL